MLSNRCFTSNRWIIFLGAPNGPRMHPHLLPLLWCTSDLVCREEPWLYRSINWRSYCMCILFYTYVIICLHVYRLHWPDTQLSCQIGTSKLRRFAGSSSSCSSVPSAPPGFVALGSQRQGSQHVRGYQRRNHGLVHAIWESQLTYIFQRGSERQRPDFFEETIGFSMK